MLASFAIRDYFPGLSGNPLSKHIKALFVAWDLRVAGCLDKQTWFYASNSVSTLILSHQ